MKNRYSSICKSFLLIILFAGAFSAFSQTNSKPKEGQAKKSNDNNFEGVIHLVQESVEDTSYFTYWVKDEIVRLDIIDKGKKSSDNYILFDLKNNVITAIKPSRKMFINVPVKPYVDNKDQNFQIIKSKNCKKIQGYKCYQWRVKNIAQNTEVSYWVARDNFTFFEDFLKLWNRSEKHVAYFLQMPEAFGYFPMLSEERTILRDQKMTLRVVEITKQKLDTTLFLVPQGFKSYEH